MDSMVYIPDSVKKAERNAPYYSTLRKLLENAEEVARAGRTAHQHDEGDPQVVNELDTTLSKLISIRLSIS